MLDIHMTADQEVDADDEGEEDLARIPAMLEEFEGLFWQHKYLQACRVVRRAVSWLKNDVMQAHKDVWMDASLKLCRVLMRLASFDEAIGHLRYVLLQETQHGTPPAHVHMIEPSTELVCHLLEKGQYTEADLLLTKLSSSGIASRLDDQHPLICRLHYARASLLFAQGALEPALEKLRAAEAGQTKRLLAGDSMYSQLLDTRLRVLQVMHAMHDVAAAQKESNKLQHELEKMFGNDSYEGAVLKYFSGCWLLEQADYKSADTLLRAVNQTIGKCVGAKLATVHPFFLLSAAKIADIGQQQGRYSDADFMYSKTMDSIAASQLDADHSLYVAEISEGYSKLLLPMGRPAQAIKLLSGALDARHKVIGMNRQALFSTYVLVAFQEIALGRLSHARDSLQNLCDIQEFCEITVLQKADVKAVQATLALALMQDLEYAAACMREALDARAAALPTNHPLLALSKLHLATILIEMHRLEETQKLAREVASTLSYIYGKSSTHIARVNRLQARVLRERGSYEEAEVLLKDALTFDTNKEWVDSLVRSNYRKAVPVKNPAVLEDLELLASINYWMGKLDITGAILQETQAVATDIYGELQHPSIARVLVASALIKKYSGHFAEAHSMLAEGVDMQLLMLGPKHPHVILSQLELVEMHQLVGDAQAAVQCCSHLRTTLLSASSANDLRVLPCPLCPCNCERPLSLLSHCCACAQLPSV